MLEAILFVAGPHHLWHAKIPVETGRTTASLGMETSISIEWILFEVLLLQKLGGEAIVALRGQFSVLTIGFPELLTFFVDVAGCFLPPIEAVLTALVPLHVCRAISFDPISEFQELVRELHQFLGDVCGFVQILAVERRPVGRHHRVMLAFAGILSLCSRSLAEVGRAMRHLCQVSLVEGAIELMR